MIRTPKAMRTLSIAASSAVILTGFAVLAPAANATDGSPSDTASLRTCPEVGSVYYTTTEKGKYIGDRSTRTYGKKGGTITIALGESVTTGGSITGTTSAEAGVIFAKASVSVGVTVKKDWTSSVTRSYSWKVPNNQATGWIEAGHRAYAITYTQTKIVAPCNTLKKSGTITGNTGNVQFDHS